MKNIRKLILVLLATGVVCTSSAIAGYAAVKQIELSSLSDNPPSALDLPINVPSPNAGQAKPARGF